MRPVVEPEDIVGFARKHSGASLHCGLHGDLLAAMGAEGDDASEFLEAFADSYSVDMADFLWFFHYNADEPPSFQRARPVDRDGRSLARIPITPSLLADAANQGRWPLEYPVHRMQVSRWPMRLMSIFLATLVLSIILLASD